MKYERLTDPFVTNEVLLPLEEQGLSSDDKRYIRLSELEDKIENGTLVELPFAIGQKIYSVIAKPRFVKEQYINEFEVDAYSVEKDRIDIIHYIEDDGIHRVYWTYESENAFLTKAEAEKRLAELRGEAAEEVIMTGPIVVGDVPDPEEDPIITVEDTKPVERHNPGKTFFTNKR